MQKTYLVQSSLLLGDLIYALPGMRQIWKNSGANFRIYLGLNQEWPMNDMSFRTHRPNKQVTLDQADFDRMKPLLEAQPYIESILPWKDEPVHINLDEVMAKEINVPYGFLPRWFFYLWPDLACDLSKPWLDNIPNEHGEMILISRSSRYHNPRISYEFLKDYRDSILFIGHDDEWMSFCKGHFEVAHKKVTDFMEMARLINSCRFFIGNQSFPFALAEALKVPRILELYSPLPNIIPHGEHAYDFYAQDALEYYATQMIIKTDKIPEKKLEELKRKFQK